jgi:putative aldouronate transport system permease protein
MKIRKKHPFTAFDIVNTAVMIAIIVVTIYPFWFAIIGSLNNGLDYMKGGVYLLPRQITLANFNLLFNSTSLLNAYKITILRTVLGTLLHLLVTALFAYAFSRKYAIGRKTYATLGLITMIFSGGIIPYFVLLKQLNLINNFLVYVIPTAFSFWNVLIMQTFFREIPDSLIESAKIDGADEYKVFFRIIIPLSTPVLAAVALFVGVSQWNAYYDALMYVSDPKLQPIQLILMKIVRTKEAASTIVAQAPGIFRKRNEVSSITIQLAAMVVTAAPIILLYPFLQKYFVKGIMIGAIKG